MTLPPTSFKRCMCHQARDCDGRGCPECDSRNVIEGGTLGWHHQTMECRDCGTHYVASREYWVNQEVSA